MDPHEAVFREFFLDAHQAHKRHDGTFLIGKVDLDIIIEPFDVLDIIVVEFDDRIAGFSEVQYNGSGIPVPVRAALFHALHPE